MTGSVIFFTVATANRQAAVRVLWESLLARMPGVRCVTVFADPATGVEALPGETLEAAGLGIPRWRHLAFRYTALEWCCALKPFAAAWLLDRHPGATVVYLDSDCWLLQAPTALIAGTAAMTLLPHRTSPPLADGAAADLQVRCAGQFNAGAFAVRAGAGPLLAWWAERVRTHGYQRPEQGMHADQAWLDFLPVYWPDRVEVLRDPGYDVAHWNLAQRPVTRTADGRLLAGPVPLVLLHASGFDPVRPDLPSRHAPELGWEACGPAARPVFEDYARALLAAGWQQDLARPYGWAVLADGSPLYGYLRDWFAEAVEPGADADLDPFSLDPALRDRLLAPVAGSLCPAFALAVHRGDVRARRRFPEVPGSDEPRFLRWLVELDGMDREPYRSLLDPVRRRLADLPPCGLPDEGGAEWARRLDHWRSCAEHHIRLAQDLQIELRVLAERGEDAAAARGQAAVQAELARQAAGEREALRSDLDAAMRTEAALRTRLAEVEAQAGDLAGQRDRLAARLSESEDRLAASSAAVERQTAALAHAGAVLAPGDPPRLSLPGNHLRLEIDGRERSLDRRWWRWFGR